LSRFDDNFADFIISNLFFIENFSFVLKMKEKTSAFEFCGEIYFANNILFYFQVPPGVNFINIFAQIFLYKSALHSFSLVTKSKRN